MQTTSLVWYSEFKRDRHLRLTFYFLCARIFWCVFHWFLVLLNQVEMWDCILECDFKTELLAWICYKNPNVANNVQFMDKYLSFFSSVISHFLHSIHSPLAHSHPVCAFHWCIIMFRFKYFKKKKSKVDIKFVKVEDPLFADGVYKNGKVKIASGLPPNTRTFRPLIKNKKKNHLSLSLLLHFSLSCNSDILGNEISCGRIEEETGTGVAKARDSTRSTDCSC